MSGRQPVKVTYSNKKRRAQGASMMRSSPLEVLPPDKDDLTPTEMTRRMLKRSRRAALAEQVVDKNIDDDGRVAKRIKHAEERVVNVTTKPSAISLDMPLPPDDLRFETPFRASRHIHGSAAAKPVVPDHFLQFLCPDARSIAPALRTSKKIAPTPKLSRHPSIVVWAQLQVFPPQSNKGKARSLHASRTSLHRKSRFLSGVSKENTRQISRKDSTISLDDNRKNPPDRPTISQRYPETSYMRSQVPQQDWFAPTKALPRPFDGCDGIASPHGSVQSSTSFFNAVPQFCSTPVVSRPQNRVGMPAPIDTNGPPAFLGQNNSIIHANDVYIDIADDVLPNRRQTLHLSGNSIFSSSGEFTIEPIPFGSIPATNTTATAVETNMVSSCTGQDALVASDKAADGPSKVGASQTRRKPARPFIGEYVISLPTFVSSPVGTAATNGPIVVPPAPSVPKKFVGTQAFTFHGTSSPAPEAGRRSPDVVRSFHTTRPTPPASAPRIRSSNPSSSAAADLAQEMQSLDIGGDAGTHSNGGAPPTKKPSPRYKPTSNSAPGCAKTDLSLPAAVPPPKSRLFSGPALPSREVMSTAVVDHPTIDSTSDSDDELLLIGPWVKDLTYLGVPAPAHVREVEADELNVVGLWRDEEWGSSRRLRKRDG
ncbi:hypothetical protein BU15DRAFT_71707 [Melanogaster broomeanus]|nr:hypothetical protein BU15DRAFT_71707 [Melanogaster broomeanus]